jgi:hypothetical protein
MTHANSARFGGDGRGPAPGVGRNAAVAAAGQRSAAEAHYRSLDQITAHSAPGSRLAGRTRRGAP